MLRRHCFQLRVNYLHTGSSTASGTFIISKADKQRANRSGDEQLPAAAAFLSRRICLEELLDGGFKVDKQERSIFMCRRCGVHEI
jgi:hypothetical protein